MERWGLEVRDGSYNDGRRREFVHTNRNPGIEWSYGNIPR
jgi:hypothetical protein